uniref:Secreted protein n=1 Tax=Haemonchus contortus TaxID=6289 RepID=A0A7I4YAM3_HAECO|nr:Protein B0393.9, isoform b [Haemonchus contortus]
MRSLLLILTFSVGAYSQCIFLQCDPPPTTAPCKTCYDCMGRGKGFNFCFTGESLRCGCVSDKAKTCSRVRARNSGDITACKLHAPIRVPLPMIRSLSNTSLSVVVDRFFGRAPFDALSPHRLMLLADFMTKDEVKCKSLPTIRAMKWARHHCALRIHLAMPGIDNPSDDQYYYDDLSPIETEFSAEIFEGAELVRFWVEVSTIRSLELAHEVVRFSSVMRSEAATYRPPHHTVPSRNDTVVSGLLSSMVNDTSSS